MPLDARRLGFQAVTVSSNKCMQGVPGIGWSVVQTTALENSRGNCQPDPWDQNHHNDRTNAIRFAPPTQVMAAFAQACREHAAEGGTEARLARHRANWRRLVDGMRQMEFNTVVPDEYASPIVATFRNPHYLACNLRAPFEGMKTRGFIILPGRSALAETVTAVLPVAASVEKQLQPVTYCDGDVRFASLLAMMNDRPIRLLCLERLCLELLPGTLDPC